MERPLTPGHAVDAHEPTRATTPTAAVTAASGRPVAVEAYDEGERFQAHLTPDGASVFGAADPDAVERAVGRVVAESAILLGRVARDGVRFDDLLWLDGQPLVGRPTSARLEQLGHIAPVALMVERTVVEEPGWTQAFLAHIRERGHDGVRVRVLAAPWPPGADDDVVALFAAEEQAEQG